MKFRDGSWKVCTPLNVKGLCGEPRSLFAISFLPSNFVVGHNLCVIHISVRHGEG